MMRYVKKMIRNLFYRNISENCGICILYYVVNSLKILLPIRIECNHKNNENMQTIENPKLLTTISICMIICVIVGTVLSFDVVIDNDFDKSINDLIIISNISNSILLLLIQLQAVVNRSDWMLEQRGFKRIFDYSLQIPNLIILPKNYVFLSNIISFMTLTFILIICLGFFITSFITYPTYTVKIFIKQTLWIITFYYDMAVCAAYIIECSLCTVLIKNVNAKIKEILIMKRKLKPLLVFTIDNKREITHLLYYLRKLTRLRCAIYLNFKTFESFVNPCQLFYTAIGTFTLILNFFIVLKIIFNETNDLFSMTTIFLEIRLLITCIVMFSVLISLAVFSKTVS